MRDEGIIYGALAVFLAAITFPVTYNLAAGKTSRAPELKRPAEAKQCVAPVDTMRKSHMDLLVNWRERVVREGVRTYTAASGAKYNMSLTGTCLQQCHGAKQDFCDRCHGYVGVKGPYCFDCHVNAVGQTIVVRDLPAPADDEKRSSAPPRPPEARP